MLKKPAAALARADKIHVTTASDSPVQEKAIAALNQLPPFSPTLNRLLASLAKEDVFVAEIARIVEKDAVLAGQVLKLVNSALYARSGTINSVGHAVAILGLNKLRNLALSMSVTRMWKQMKTPPSWSQADFNMHSVATALMADGLAQNLGVHYPEGAFTAGLLHAMGKMLFAFGLPVEFEEAVKEYGGGQPAETIEHKRIGCCHSDLAAMALAHWKLPVEIQAAVKHQHEWLPERDGKRELSSLLHLAHDIVHQLNVSFAACPVPEQPSLDAVFGDLGLAERQERILGDFRREFEALRAFF